MSLLTLDALANCYDFLAETKPFVRLGLPPSDEILFVITRHRDRRGDYYWDGKRHVIRISSVNVKRTDGLVRTMAHEMLHLAEEHNGLSKRNVEHSKTFLKLAKQVCRIHGFDEAEF